RLAILASNQSRTAVLRPDTADNGIVPEMRGIGLKDALELCELNGWRVVARGKGKVVDQSVEPGTNLPRGERVMLTLN
ncbi:MAG TPA: PASTA domain-containing protein, partial [Phnomibacter sp.]|nr:PASTA domain-containing protein [Phnomibacter sp.]